jgi:reductive dehalogenase
MSKYHSSVSRRTFMKALGMTGAGLGVAAATAPVFHDLDEMMAAPSAVQPAHPWWIKERELMNPTTEVDWDLMIRADNRFAVQGDLSRSHYPSYSRYSEINAAGKARREERYANDEAGYDLKWRALSAGRSDRSDHPDWEMGGLDPNELGDSNVDLGKPAWTGTPEEASRLMMAAIRYMGMPMIGFAELNNTYRNKIVMEFTRSDRGARAGDVLDPRRADRYVYEDVPRAYQEEYPEGGSKLVIPTKPVSLLVLGTPQTPEARKTNAIIANTNSTIPSNFHSSIEARLSRFLHTLGSYQLFGQTGHQSMPVNAGVGTAMTGLGELSRQQNYALSWELGPNYNPFTILTDLVVAPTKPIDAGMWRFCHSCGICAEQCPSNSISTEKEPSWEMPLIEGGLPMNFHHVGPKMFWIDMLSCRLYVKGYDGCAPKEKMGDWGGGRSCYAVCPFGEDRAAAIHDVIRVTTATTGIFNSFFANMAGVFGVGNYNEDPDVWWDMRLPSHGSPSHIGATKGQWKMK